VSEFNDVLRRLDLCTGLSDEELNALYSKMEQVAPAGTEIFREGDPGNSLCVLWTGNVEILKRTTEGEMQKITSLEVGACIGEMGLIRNRVRSGTARAVVDSVVLLLKRERLEEIQKEKPHLWGMLMRNIAVSLASRLESMDRRMLQSATKDSSSSGSGKGLLRMLWG
jgi:CRP/FNR family cyclic AMP-dependent transcriptional regulator